jgi:ATP-dependent RNA helicase RhlE
MDFSTLGLSPALLRAVADSGYTTPTPIQQRAIPHVLAGRDLLGLAQTGTGKTAAFALPILQRLSAKAPEAPRSGRKRDVRVLIVTPTRELASQIAESFEVYGKHLDLTSGVVFGGVNMNPQEAMLRRGVDILVATPGRLLDHLGRDVFRLDRLEVFVLDEADQMLDMGFEPDVRRILRAIPKTRQTLFFSATMPTRIRKLADAMLDRPVEVAVVPESTAAERVTQTVYHVDSADKRSLLVHLLADRSLARVLVFSRTKHGANRIAAHLNEYGSPAAPIHGNKSQAAREKALAAFKTGEIRVLVATDIAARGLDIDDVTHVVNFDLPEVPETYVHRIGRTARAGADGASVAFCAPDERPLLADIERAMRQKVPVAEVPAITRLTFTDPPRGPKPERGSRGRGRAPAGQAPRERAPRQDAAPRGEAGRGPTADGGGGSRSGGGQRDARGRGRGQRASDATRQGRPAAPAPAPGRAPSQAPARTASAPARAPAAPPRPARVMPGESLSGGKPRR